MATAVATAANAAASDTAASATPYTVVPHGGGCAFGGEVTGYDVRAALDDPAAIKRIRDDLTRHRLLVFHGQTELSSEDHLALSECLGSMDHGLHRVHPKTPDPRLLRVSNDENEGFRGAGMSGFHVDGVMLKAPFAAQTMHFLSAVEGGDTFFLGLNEVLRSLDNVSQDRCRRLWFLSGLGKDLMSLEGQLSILPLVYRHPRSGEETMCFHLGESYCVGWVEEEPAPTGLGAIIPGLFGGPPVGKAEEALIKHLVNKEEVERSGAPPIFRLLAPRPTQEQLRQVVDSLNEETRRRAVWRQTWASGDLALIDNMALAHLPAPGTQAWRHGDGRRAAAGLRLFHRTTMVDPTAVICNARGAPSVLLSVEDGDGSGSLAGARGDAQAMRAILDALNEKTAEFKAILGASSPPGGIGLGDEEEEREGAAAVAAAPDSAAAVAGAATAPRDSSASPTAAPPKVRDPTRSKMASRLRQKAAAGRAQREQEGRGGSASGRGEPGEAAAQRL